MKTKSIIKKAVLLLFIMICFGSCTDPNEGSPSTEQTDPRQLVLDCDITGINATRTENIIKVDAEEGNYIPLSLVYKNPNGQEIEIKSYDSYYLDNGLAKIIINGTNYGEYGFSSNSHEYEEESLLVFENSNNDMTPINFSIYCTSSERKRIEIKFNYLDYNFISSYNEPVESNTLVFLFNEELTTQSAQSQIYNGDDENDPSIDINPSASLTPPSIVGTWTSEHAGLIKKLIFNENGTGTAISGNEQQSTTFNWRTYKEGLNNMLEITNCSWFSGLDPFSYSIEGNTLTTEKKLGTNGHMFTRND